MGRCFRCLGGILGSILSALGSLCTFLGALGTPSWAPFWAPLGCLGLHFEWSGGRLGTFLGALGVSGAPFRGLQGCLGLHFGSSGDLVGGLGGPWGLPWPPKGPKAKLSHFFPSHFGVILAQFWKQKPIKNLMQFLIDYVMVCWSMFG